MNFVYTELSHDSSRPGRVLESGLVATFAVLTFWVCSANVVNTRSFFIILIFALPRTHWALRADRPGGSPVMLQPFSPALLSQSHRLPSKDTESWGF